MSYNANSLTNFLFTAVASDSTLVNSGTFVCYENFITEDINQTPIVYINWLEKILTKMTVGLVL